MPRQVASIVRGSVLRSKVLSLAKTCEIGRVAWQEEQLGAGAADQPASRLALVTAEIVHDDDVAGAQARHQKLLDIGAKAGAVDRPVEDAGCGDAVMAQRRQERHGAPAAMRHLGDQSGAARTAPVRRVMLVLAQVSSRNTRRRGSSRP